MNKSISDCSTLPELYSCLEANASTLPLARGPLDIVPGEGSPQAEMMFIGEAPGQLEAELRRPFVGRSGQLFRTVLKQVGFTEAEVFISNIVKVRPPDNRDPLPEEIAAYRPYLDQEIKIIQPKLIVTLGRFSMAKFLKDAKVSQVHGRLHKVVWYDKPIFVLPMYHPAAALRAPKVKESFIEDFQKLTKVLPWVREQAESLQHEAHVAAALL